MVSALVMTVTESPRFSGLRNELDIGDLEVASNALVVEAHAPSPRFPDGTHLRRSLDLDSYQHLPVVTIDLFQARICDDAL